MTKKLRFEIVGCGVTGPYHAQAITSLPDAELAAVADLIPERAQNLTEKFQVTTYGDFQEMLARLRFANGALGTISATTGAYPGVSTRIEIYGDKGSAVIEDDRLSYFHLARDDREEIGPYGVAPEQHVPLLSRRFVSSSGSCCTFLQEPCSTDRRYDAADP